MMFCMYAYLLGNCQYLCKHVTGTVSICYDYLSGNCQHLCMSKVLFPSTVICWSQCSQCTGRLHGCATSHSQLLDVPSACRSHQCCKVPQDHHDCLQDCLPSLHPFCDFYAFTTSYTNSHTNSSPSLTPPLTPPLHHPRHRLVTPSYTICSPPLTACERCLFLPARTASFVKVAEPEGSQRQAVCQHALLSVQVSHAISALFVPTYLLVRHSTPSKLLL